jgi:hypothetical protein
MLAAANYAKPPFLKKKCKTSLNIMISIAKSVISTVTVQVVIMSLNTHRSVMKLPLVSVGLLKCICNAAFLSMKNVHSRSEKKSQVHILEVKYPQTSQGNPVQSKLT